MPQLLVRGISPEQLSTISSALLTDLAQVCSCGRDNFMLEYVHTTAVQDGEFVPSYPFIEVAWFERGTEVRDAFAEALARHILPLGIAEFETAFVTYREDSYYVNGRRTFG